MSGNESRLSDRVDGRHLLIALMVLDDITDPDMLLRCFKKENRDRIRAYPSGLTLAELEKRHGDRFGDWIG